MRCEMDQMNVILSRLKINLSRRYPHWRTATPAEVQCCSIQSKFIIARRIGSYANIVQCVPYLKPLQTMAYLGRLSRSLHARAAIRHKTTQDVRIVMIFKSWADGTTSVITLMPPNPLERPSRLLAFAFPRNLGPPRWNYPINLISVCSCRTKITHQNFPSVLKYIPNFPTIPTLTVGCSASLPSMTLIPAGIFCGFRAAMLLASAP